jgi:hypothetical protein
MNIFDRVKRLNLPLSQYVIFGSGPLEAHGIRATRDTDLLVTPELYQELKRRPGWSERDWSDGGRYLAFEEVEADDSWDYGAYNPHPEEVIARAEMINGLPFAPISDVLAWKKAFNRPKDQVDIKLIEEYLAKS